MSKNKRYLTIYKFNAKFITTVLNDLKEFKRSVRKSSIIVSIIVGVVSSLIASFIYNYFLCIDNNLTIPSNIPRQTPRILENSLIIEKYILNI